MAETSTSQVPFVGDRMKKEANALLAAEAGLVGYVILTAAISLVLSHQVAYQVFVSRSFSQWKAYLRLLYLSHPVQVVAIASALSSAVVLEVVRRYLYFAQKVHVQPFHIDLMRPPPPVSRSKELSRSVKRKVGPVKNKPEFLCSGTPQEEEKRLEEYIERLNSIRHPSQELKRLLSALKGLQVQLHSIHEAHSCSGEEKLKKYFDIQNLCFEQVRALEDGEHCLLLGISFYETRVYYRIQCHCSPVSGKKTYTLQIIGSGCNEGDSVVHRLATHCVRDRILTDARNPILTAKDLTAKKLFGLLWSLFEESPFAILEDVCGEKGLIAPLVLGRKVQKESLGILSKKEAEALREQQRPSLKRDDGQTPLQRIVTGLPGVCVKTIYSRFLYALMTTPRWNLGITLVTLARGWRDILDKKAGETLSDEGNVTVVEALKKLIRDLDSVGEKSKEARSVLGFKEKDLSTLFFSLLKDDQGVAFPFFTEEDSNLVVKRLSPTLFDEELSTPVQGMLELMTSPDSGIAKRLSKKALQWKVQFTAHPSDAPTEMQLHDFIDLFSKLELGKDYSKIALFLACRDLEYMMQMTTPWSEQDGRCVDRLLERADQLLRQDPLGESEGNALRAFFLGCRSRRAGGEQVVKKAPLPGVPETRLLPLKREVVVSTGGKPKVVKSGLPEEKIELDQRKWEGEVDLSGLWGKRRKDPLDDREKITQWIEQYNKRKLSMFAPHQRMLSYQRYQPPTPLTSSYWRLSHDLLTLAIPGGRISPEQKRELLGVAESFSLWDESERKKLAVLCKENRPSVVQEGDIIARTLQRLRSARSLRGELQHVIEQKRSLDLEDPIREGFVNLVERAPFQEYFDQNGVAIPKVKVVSYLKTQFAKRDEAKNIREHYYRILLFLLHWHEAPWRTLQRCVEWHFGVPYVDIEQRWDLTQCVSLNDDQFLQAIEQCPLLMIEEKRGLYESYYENQPIDRAFLDPLVKQGLPLQGSIEEVINRYKTYSPPIQSRIRECLVRLVRDAPIEEYACPLDGVDDDESQYWLDKVIKRGFYTTTYPLWWKEMMKRWVTAQAFEPQVYGKWMHRIDSMEDGAEYPEMMKEIADFEPIMGSWNLIGSLFHRDDLVDAIANAGKIGVIWKIAPSLVSWYQNKSSNKTSLCLPESRVRLCELIPRKEVQELLLQQVAKWTPQEKEALGSDVFSVFFSDRVEKSKERLQQEIKSGNLSLPTYQTLQRMIRGGAPLREAAKQRCLEGMRKMKLSGVKKVRELHTSEAFFNWEDHLDKLEGSLKTWNLLLDPKDELRVMDREILALLQESARFVTELNSSWTQEVLGPLVEKIKQYRERVGRCKSIGEFATEYERVKGDLQSIIHADEEKRLQYRILLSISVAGQTKEFSDAIKALSSWEQNEADITKEVERYQLDSKRIKGQFERDCQSRKAAAQNELKQQKEEGKKQLTAPGVTSQAREDIRALLKRAEQTCESTIAQAEKECKQKISGEEKACEKKCLQHKEEKRSKWLQENPLQDKKAIFERAHRDNWITTDKFKEIANFIDALISLERARSLHEDSRLPDLPPLSNLTGDKGKLSQDLLQGAKMDDDTIRHLWAYISEASVYSTEPISMDGCSTLYQEQLSHILSENHRFKNILSGIGAQLQDRVGVSVISFSEGDAQARSMQYWRGFLIARVRLFIRDQIKKGVPDLKFLDSEVSWDTYKGVNGLLQSYREVYDGVASVERNCYRGHPIQEERLSTALRYWLRHSVNRTHSLWDDALQQIAIENQENTWLNPNLIRDRDVVLDDVDSPGFRIVAFQELQHCLEKIKTKHTFSYGDLLEVRPLFERCFLALPSLGYEEAQEWILLLKAVLEQLVSYLQFQEHKPPEGVHIVAWIVTWIFCLSECIPEDDTQSTIVTKAASTDDHKLNQKLALFSKGERKSIGSINLNGVFHTDIERRNHGTEDLKKKRGLEKGLKEVAHDIESKVIELKEGGVIPPEMEGRQDRNQLGIWAFTILFPSEGLSYHSPSSQHWNKSELRWNQRLLWFMSQDSAERKAAYKKLKEHVDSDGGTKELVIGDEGLKIFTEVKKILEPLLVERSKIGAAALHILRGVPDALHHWGLPDALCPKMKERYDPLEMNVDYIVRSLPVVKNPLFMIAFLGFLNVIWEGGMLSGDEESCVMMQAPVLAKDPMLALNKKLEQLRELQPGSPFLKHIDEVKSTWKPRELSSFLLCFRKENVQTLLLPLLRQYPGLLKHEDVRIVLEALLTEISLLYNDSKEKDRALSPDEKELPDPYVFSMVQEILRWASDEGIPVYQKQIKEATQQKEKLKGDDRYVLDALIFYIKIVLHLHTHSPKADEMRERALEAVKSLETYVVETNDEEYWKWVHLLQCALEFAPLTSLCLPLSRPAIDERTLAPDPDLSDVTWSLQEVHDLLVKYIVLTQEVGGSETEDPYLVGTLRERYRLLIKIVEYYFSQHHEVNPDAFWDSVCNAICVQAHFPIQKGAPWAKQPGTSHRYTQPEGGVVIDFGEEGGIYTGSGYRYGPMPPKVLQDPLFIAACPGGKQHGLAVCIRGKDHMTYEFYDMHNTVCRVVIPYQKGDQEPITLYKQITLPKEHVKKSEEAKRKEKESEGKKSEEKKEEKQFLQFIPFEEIAYGDPHYSPPILFKLLQLYRDTRVSHHNKGYFVTVDGKMKFSCTLKYDTLQRRHYIDKVTDHRMLWQPAGTEPIPARLVSARHYHHPAIDVLCEVEHPDNLLILEQEDGRILIELTMYGIILSGKVGSSELICERGEDLAGRRFQYDTPPSGRKHLASCLVFDHLTDPTVQRILVMPYYTTEDHKSPEGTEEKKLKFLAIRTEHGELRGPQGRPVTLDCGVQGFCKIFYTRGGLTFYDGSQSPPNQVGRIPDPQEDRARQNNSYARLILHAGVLGSQDSFRSKITVLKQYIQQARYTDALDVLTAVSRENFASGLDEYQKEYVRILFKGPYDDYHGGQAFLLLKLSLFLRKMPTCENLISTEQIEELLRIYIRDEKTVLERLRFDPESIHYFLTLLLHGKVVNPGFKSLNRILDPEEMHAYLRYGEDSVLTRLYLLLKEKSPPEQRTRLELFENFLWLFKQEAVALMVQDCHKRLNLVGEITLKLTYFVCGTVWTLFEDAVRQHVYLGVIKDQSWEEIIGSAHKIDISSHFSQIEASLPEELEEEGSIVQEMLGIAKEHVMTAWEELSERPKEVSVQAPHVELVKIARSEHLTKTVTPEQKVYIERLVKEIPRHLEEVLLLVSTFLGAITERGLGDKQDLFLREENLKKRKEACDHRLASLKERVDELRKIVPEDQSIMAFYEAIVEGVGVLNQGLQQFLDQSSYHIDGLGELGNQLVALVTRPTRDDSREYWIGSLFCCCKRIGETWKVCAQEMRRLKIIAESCAASTALSLVERKDDHTLVTRSNALLPELQDLLNKLFIESIPTIKTMAIYPEEEDLEWAEHLLLEDMQIAMDFVSAAPYRWHTLLRASSRCKELTKALEDSYKKTEADKESAWRHLLNILGDYNVTMMKDSEIGVTVQDYQKEIGGRHRLTEQRLCGALLRDEWSQLVQEGLIDATVDLNELKKALVDYFVQAVKLRHLFNTNNLWKKIMEKEAEKGGRQWEADSQDLYKMLAVKRYYDPHQQPKLILFEYIVGLTFRADKEWCGQVQKVEQMLKHPRAVTHAPTGFGKTKVLTVVLQLFFSNSGIPIVVKVLPALEEQTFRELRTTLGQAFEQKIFRFSFDFGMPLRDPKTKSSVFKKYYEQFKEMKNEGIVVTNYVSIPLLWEKLCQLCLELQDDLDSDPSTGTLEDSLACLEDPSREVLFEGGGLRSAFHQALCFIQRIADPDGAMELRSLPLEEQLKTTAFAVANRVADTRTERVKEEKPFVKDVTRKRRSQKIEDIFYIQEILKILRKAQVVHDEFDIPSSPKQLLQIKLEEGHPVAHWLAYVVKDIVLRLITLEDGSGKKDPLFIRDGMQGRLDPKRHQEVLKILANQLAMEFVQKHQDPCEALAITQAAIQDYLVGEHDLEQKMWDGLQQERYLYDLDVLVCQKDLISRLLPVMLKNTEKIRFGKEEKDLQVQIHPYKDGIPQERSEFSLALERLFYVAASLFAKEGITETYLKKWLEDIRLNVTTSEAGKKLFSLLFNKEGDQTQYDDYSTDPDNPEKQESFVQYLLKRLEEDPELRGQFIESVMTRSVFTGGKVISMNVNHQMNMHETIIPLSATPTGMQYALPPHIEVEGEPMLVMLATMVFDQLLRGKRCDETVYPFSIKSTDTVAERMKTILQKGGDFSVSVPVSVLIDEVGAFINFDKKEVAGTLKETFNELSEKLQGKPTLKQVRYSDNPAHFEGEPKAQDTEIGMYFQVFQTRGTDVVLCASVKGAVLFSCPYKTLEDLLQSIGRLRKESQTCVLHELVPDGADLTPKQLKDVLCSKIRQQQRSSAEDVFCACKQTLEGLLWSPIYWGFLNSSNPPRLFERFKDILLKPAEPSYDNAGEYFKQNRELKKAVPTMELLHYKRDHVAERGFAEFPTLYDEGTRALRPGSVAALCWVRERYIQLEEQRTIPNLPNEERAILEDELTEVKRLYEDLQKCWTEKINTPITVRRAHKRHTQGKIIRRGVGSVVVGLGGVLQDYEPGWTTVKEELSLADASYEALKDRLFTEDDRENLFRIEEKVEWIRREEAVKEKCFEDTGIDQQTLSSIDTILEKSVQEHGRIPRPLLLVRVKQCLAEISYLEARLEKWITLRSVLIEQIGRAALNMNIKDRIFDALKGEWKGDYQESDIRQWIGVYLTLQDAWGKGVVSQESVKKDIREMVAQGEQKLVNTTAYDQIRKVTFHGYDLTLVDELEQAIDAYLKRAYATLTESLVNTKAKILEDGCLKDPRIKDMVDQLVNKKEKKTEQAQKKIQVKSFVQTYLLLQQKRAFIAWCSESRKEAYALLGVERQDVQIASSEDIDCYMATEQGKGLKEKAKTKQKGSGGLDSRTLVFYLRTLLRLEQREHFAFEYLCLMEAMRCVDSEKDTHPVDEVYVQLKNPELGGESSQTAPETKSPNEVFNECIHDYRWLSTMEDRVQATTVLDKTEPQLFDEVTRQLVSLSRFNQRLEEPLDEEEGSIASSDQENRLSQEQETLLRETIRLHQMMLVSERERRFYQAELRKQGVPQYPTREEHPLLPLFSVDEEGVSEEEDSRYAAVGTQHPVTGGADQTHCARMIQVNQWLMQWESDFCIVRGLVKGIEELMKGEDLLSKLASRMKADVLDDGANQGQELHQAKEEEEEQEQEQEQMQEQEQEQQQEQEQEKEYLQQGAPWNPTPRKPTKDVSHISNILNGTPLALLFPPLNLYVTDTFLLHGYSLKERGWKPIQQVWLFRHKKMRLEYDRNKGEWVRRIEEDIRDWCIVDPSTMRPEGPEKGVYQFFAQDHPQWNDLETTHHVWSIQEPMHPQRGEGGDAAHCAPDENLQWILTTPGDPVVFNKKDEEILLQIKILDFRVDGYSKEEEEIFAGWIKWKAPEYKTSLDRYFGQYWPDYAKSQLQRMVTEEGKKP